jgi:hypothetical protein
MGGSRWRATASASAASIAAILAGTLVGIAFAHRPHIPSRISIHTRCDATATEPFIYSGRVRSERGGCIRHRTVLLKNDSEPGSLGTDTTNAYGRWKIALPGDLLEGEYHAKTIRRAKPRFVCKAARSKSVPAPTPGP